MKSPLLSLFVLRFASCLWATLALLLLSTQGTQAAVSPEAQKVIDAHIQAVGGREKLEAIHCRITKGTLSMPSLGMQLTLVSYAEAPNRMAVHTEIPGMGTSISGFDGKTGWEQNPITGFRMIEGDELLQLKRYSEIAIELSLDSLYASIDRVDDEDGLTVLELKTSNGKTERWYFDPKTHRLSRTDMVMDAGPMGSIPVQILLEDYRQVDGMMIAFRTIMRNPAFEAITQYETISHPDSIDPDLFAIPDTAGID